MFEEKEEEQLKRLQQIRIRVRDEGLDPMYKAKSQTDDQFILSCLKNHFVFYNLSQAQINNVRDYMWWTEVTMNSQIFRQGEQGSCFFLIVSGVVQVIVDGNVIKTLKAAEGFGELALLYDIDRPSTVLVREDAGLWVIDKASFRQAVEQIVIQEFQQNQKYLDGIAFYQFLTNRQKEKVASSFVTLKYYKGQNIIEEGDPGSAFYIIKSGTASLIQGNVEERKIFKGQSFGINSLYYNTMRKMTVKADDEVVCQVLGRETLAKIIGQDIYREVMFKNYVKYTLQKNKFLFALIKKDEEKVFENLKTRYYKTNEIVFKKGSIVHKLIIIIEGKIKKFRSANFLAQAGQIWGQNYLEQGSNIRLDDDIIVETESVLIELSLDSLRNVLALVEESYKPESKQIMVENIPTEQIKCIGPIQQNVVSSCYYLKYKDKDLVGKIYKKNQLGKENMAQIVKQYLQVIQIIEHPLLPQFYETIDQPNFICVISQCIKGQSLYDAIREIGLLSTADSQFYVASIISLLEYLLFEEVVIRDLKPDNFIVDEDGYLQMISLGSSKCIRKIHRTSTVVGTPHYMAPEVVLGKQYNEMVDLWAVGVMLYQFMIGELPFGAFSQNPYEIYEQVIQGNPTFPRNFKDRRAKKLIQTMLSLNPEMRHNGSYNSLKNNSWFENINWDSLSKKTSQTPFKPSNIMKLPKGQGIPLQQFFQKIK